MPQCINCGYIAEDGFFDSKNEICADCEIYYSREAKDAMIKYKSLIVDLDELQLWNKIFDKQRLRKPLDEIEKKIIRLEMGF